MRIFRTRIILCQQDIFEVKIEYVELTQEEFNEKMATYTANLEKYFSEGKSLEEEIKQRLEELKYEQI